MVLSLVLVSLIADAQESKRSLLTVSKEETPAAYEQSSSCLTGMKETENLSSVMSVLPPPGNDNFAAGLNPP